MFQVQQRTINSPAWSSSRHFGWIVIWVFPPTALFEQSVVGFRRLESDSFILIHVRLMLSIAWELLDYIYWSKEGAPNYQFVSATQPGKQLAVFAHFSKTIASQDKLIAPVVGTDLRTLMLPMPMPMSLSPQILEYYNSDCSLSPPKLDQKISLSSRIPPRW